MSDKHAPPLTAVDTPVSLCLARTLITGVVLARPVRTGRDNGVVSGGGKGIPTYGPAYLAIFGCPGTRGRAMPFCERRGYCQPLGR